MIIFIFHSAITLHNRQEALLGAQPHKPFKWLASYEEGNDFDIGVELEGTDDEAYTEQQYQALAAATKALMQNSPITVDHIVGHSDIAPG